jgi:hypothetical protein
VLHGEREGGGAGIESNPAACAAFGSWYSGLSSSSALAKNSTAPRSMRTLYAPVGFPMMLVSTAMQAPLLVGDDARG